MRQPIFEIGVNYLSRILIFLPDFASGRREEGSEEECSRAKCYVIAIISRWFAISRLLHERRDRGAKLARPPSGSDRRETAEGGFIKLQDL